VNNDILEGYHHSEAAIDKVAAQEQQDLERRERLYRDNYSAPAIRGRLFPNDQRESV